MKAVDIIQIALLVAGGPISVWLAIRMIRQSEDQRRLFFQLGWTALTVMVILALCRYLKGKIDGGVDYGMALISGGAIAGMGIAMAAIWRRNIAEWIAKPFGSIYDGGGQEVDRQPLYSIAEARRKRGYYDEAILEIRNQLARFPEDFKGQMMIAEIQAENLNDMRGAQLTVQRLCAQRGHAPRSIAFALNSLADWYLKYEQDRDAARQALERIGELFPDTDLSAMAAQRIAHLADLEHLLAHYDPKKVVLKPSVANMGLLPVDQQLKAPQEDPDREIAAYVRHLEQHPLDSEAREKLAILYADHHGRLDLAADQLEQLISHSGQPGKRVVHWLNLLADLQVRHGAGHDTVAGTIKRIIELYPGSPAARLAGVRLDHLKLELKGQTKGSTVKLGQYEQDIGLKRGLPGNKL